VHVVLKNFGDPT